MGGRQNSHDEHINAHQESAAQKRALSTNSLNEEEQEETAGDDLDNAKKAA